MFSLLELQLTGFSKYAAGFTVSLPRGDTYIVIISTDMALRGATSDTNRDATPSPQ
jgi:hypothetical protein